MDPLSLYELFDSIISIYSRILEDVALVVDLFLFHVFTVFGLIDLCYYPSAYCAKWLFLRLILLFFSRLLIVD